jgi:hypothetical protein
MAATKQRRFIEAGWRTYAEHVLPAGANAIQKQETKRAFYAGVQCLWGVAFDIGDDIVSEDEGVRRLESVTAELRQFVLDVQQGRA